MQLRKNLQIFRWFLSSGCPRTHTISIGRIADEDEDPSSINHLLSTTENTQKSREKKRDERESSEEENSGRSKKNSLRLVRTRKTKRTFPPVQVEPELRRASSGSRNSNSVVSKENLVAESAKNFQSQQDKASERVLQNMQCSVKISPLTSEYVTNHNILRSTRGTLPPDVQSENNSISRRSKR